MPRDLFMDAPSGAPAIAPRDLFAGQSAAEPGSDAGRNVDPQSQVLDAVKRGMAKTDVVSTQPPVGAMPGSREYADWAAATARSGKPLPQVSPAPPTAQQGSGAASQILDAIKRGMSINPMTAAPAFLLGKVGEVASNPDVQAAFGRDVNRLGNSMADAIQLPMDTLTNKDGINDVYADPSTGEVAPFSDQMIDRSANAAGYMTAGEGFPTRTALIDTATGRVVRAPVRRALAADKIPPGQVAERVSAIGPDATVADLGPNMQALAATGAALPGPAGDRMIEQFAARKAAGPTRIEGAVSDVLGPAPTPSDVQAQVRAGKRALGPDYESALSGAQPVDTTALAGSLDEQSSLLRGKARSALQLVRDMLDQVVDPEEIARAQHELTQEWDASGREGPKPVYKAPLESDPRVLFQIRQAVDGMLDGENDGNARRALTAARQQIDGLLAQAAPGLKAADAKYADLARQGEAVDQGQTIFDSGRGAIRPAELDAKLADSSPGVAARLSEGGRAELDRIVGTNAHDRAALERLLRGDGDWNRRRLASVFGSDKTDRLLAVLANESQTAETENAVLRAVGQRAGRSAKDELAPAPAGPGVIESAANFKPGTAAVKVANKAFGWASQMGRDHAREQILDAIMGRGAWAAPVAKGPSMPLPLESAVAAGAAGRRGPTSDEMARLIFRN